MPFANRDTRSIPCRRQSGPRKAVPANCSDSSFRRLGRSRDYSVGKWRMPLRGRMPLTLLFVARSMDSPDFATAGRCGEWARMPRCPCRIPGNRLQSIILEGNSRNLHKGYARQGRVNWWSRSRLVPRNVDRDSGQDWRQGRTCCLILRKFSSSISAIRTNDSRFPQYGEDPDPSLATLSR